MKSESNWSLSESESRREDIGDFNVSDKEAFLELTEPSLTRLQYP